MPPVVPAAGCHSPVEVAVGSMDGSTGGAAVGSAVAVAVGVGVGVAVAVAVGVGVGVGSGVGVAAGRSVTLGNPICRVGEGLGVGLGEREGEGALEPAGAGGFGLRRGAGVRPSVVGSITGSDSVAWGRLKDGTLGPEGVAVQAATASRPMVMARGMRLRMAGHLSYNDGSLS
jgi:hypothetical protein